MHEEERRESALTEMSDVIKARMQTPRAEFIEMDENDTLFDDVQRQLNSTSANRPNSTPYKRRG